MKIDFSAFIRLFLLILISAAFVSGGTKLGMFAYQSVFAMDEILPGGTSVGPVSLAGLSPKEANLKLEETVSEWKQKHQLFLTYGEQKVTIPSNSIQFIIKESVSGVKRGVSNPLLVDVSADKVQSLVMQLTSKDISSGVNTEDLAKKIEVQAGLLPTSENTIRLAAFFNPEGPVTEKVLAEADMGVEDTQNLTEPVTFDISPYSTFSFLNDIAAKYPLWSDAKLTAAASALYQASLQTNLKIIERQVSTELPSRVQVGFEAKVKRKKIDFVLSNPNDFKLHFTFQANKTGQLHVAITGYSLSKRYEVRLENKQTYPFGKIVQYSSFVPNDSEIVKQDGSNGSSVTVYRDIYSASGPKIKSEKISDDFYLPINQIVIQPVASSTSTTTDTTTGTTDKAANQNSATGITTGITTGTSGNTTIQNFSADSGTKNNNQINTAVTKDEINGTTTCY